LIAPHINATSGMLGTTFGGNHLACAAGIAVLDTLKNESLIENAAHVSEFLIPELKTIPSIKKIKGRGLMLGVEFDYPVKELRSKLLYDFQIFTGGSANPNLLRILPPLNITIEEITPFVQALKKVLK
jgi:acetylornithine aminotransferase